MLETVVKYLPTKFVRPTRVSDARGPAIVMPFVDRNEAMLVTGGAPAHTCFISGAYNGHGFLKEKAARWDGLAVEGVEFEVDLSSQFRPSLISQPLGAIIRTNGGLEILMAMKDGHGFDEAHRVPLDDGNSPTPDPLEAGFSRWRAVICQGSERIDVFTFESTVTANM